MEEEMDSIRHDVLREIKMSRGESRSSSDGSDEDVEDDIELIPAAVRSEIQMSHGASIEENSTELSLEERVDGTEDENIETAKEMLSNPEGAGADPRWSDSTMMLPRRGGFK